MKQIITFLKKIMRVDLPKPLGRWRIEECNQQLNHKVDLSNEDHCGPCGQYALNKIAYRQIAHPNLEIKRERGETNTRKS